MSNIRATNKSRTADKATVSGQAPAKPTSARKSVAQTTPGSKPKSKAPSSISRPKKPKLVRDSYTIPKDEYAVLAQLKERCKALERAVKKSELLRAGLKVLAALSDKALHAAVQAVPPLKTGRPRKS